MRHLPAEDSRHLLTPGKCRYSAASARAYQPRRGRHPRNPAIPASADPTAGMPGTREGRELGQEAEEENNRKLDKARQIREAHLRDGPRPDEDEHPKQRLHQTLPINHRHCQLLRRCVDELADGFDLPKRRAVDCHGGHQLGEHIRHAIHSCRQLVELIPCRGLSVSIFVAARCCVFWVGHG